MTDADVINLSLLPWDSVFFGVRIARLSGTILHECHLPAIENWCRANEVKCLYFLADSSSHETLQAVHKGGFKFADMRMDLELPLASFGSQQSRDPRVSAAKEEELDILEVMARSLHRNTRFFKDSNFPDERAMELYAEWLRRSFHSPRSAIFAARNSDGSPCGYIACESGESGETGRIGLIGIEESSRGQGLGKALVGAALEWLSSNGSSRARVATQADNLAAVRLYIANGFSPVEVGAWFHRWYA
jgi:dTDP-4-amino-4,6-dideoxy-D-galactose acyltransferase